MARHRQPGKGSMIYLDYQATTPLAPEAFAAMEPWLKTHFANPHSAHKAGRAAAAAVEAARAQVAALLPAGGRVIFTSGATEAINLAIKGHAFGSMAHSTTEHAAVIDSMHNAGHGAVVCPINVGAEGLLDPASLPKEAELTAIMHVNNEIGTIQPIASLAAQIHENGGLLLCDAVQSYGRIPIPEGPDMIAISAHKIYGPKGIGALWVRDGVALEAVQHGGGQEQGLRSGTLSPALCAGFGAAAQLAVQRMAADARHVATLWSHAASLFSGWAINGSATHRYKGNLNIRRDGLDVSRLMSDVRDVMFSAGSACASGSGRPSHVLSALGLSERQAKSSIRLGFGRYTTLQEIEDAAALIIAAADAQI
jgi:cysteine desulfurase